MVFWISLIFSPKACNPCQPNPKGREKIKIFIFILLFGASEGSMAFVKPFETPEGKFKSTFVLMLSECFLRLSEMRKAGKVKISNSKDSLTFWVLSVTPLRNPYQI